MVVVAEYNDPQIGKLHIVKLHPHQRVDILVDLADRLHHILHVHAGVSGEASLLVRDHEAQQGGNGHLARDLGQPQDEERGPGLAHQLHLERGLEQAEGGNGSGPVDRLEEQPRGCLTNEMYGWGGEHRAGNLKVKLGLGLVQEGTV